MELVPYNQDMPAKRRDRLERDLYEKPEIHAERRHGLDIVVYFLRKTGLVSMALSQGDQTREFCIPSEAVADAIAHPYSYMYRAGGELPDQPQLELFTEGDGA